MIITELEYVGFRVTPRTDMFLEIRKNKIKMIRHSLCVSATQSKTNCVISVDLEQIVSHFDLCYCVLCQDWHFLNKLQ